MMPNLHTNFDYYADETLHHRLARSAEQAAAASLISRVSFFRNGTVH
jgi:hypothetical protein